MDKEILELDEQLLEDILYIGAVRAMQLEFSSPKFTVTSDIDEEKFIIHCVFPFAGNTGAIVTVDFDCSRFNGQSLEVLLEELDKLQAEIILKVHKQVGEVSEKRKKRGLDE